MARISGVNIPDNKRVIIYPDLYSWDWSLFSRRNTAVKSV